MQINKGELLRKIVTIAKGVFTNEKQPTSPAQTYNQVPLCPKRYTLQDKAMMVTGATVCAATLWFVPGIFHSMVSVEPKTKPKQIAQSVVVITLPEIHGGNTVHTAISTVFFMGALAYIFQNDLRNL